MQKVTTKDRVIEAALILFSEKGYDGVGVDLIAESVGIKGPSLYKHFKGKEDILNALIEKVEIYYDQNFGTPEHIGRLPVSGEELAESTLKRIEFTIHDDKVKKVRCLLAKEQFRNERIAELTTRHHLDGIQGIYSRIFEGMMAEGHMKQDDPKELAMEYLAPITLLIHMQDRQPERAAEAMERMESHIRHFIKEYCC